MLHLFSFFFFHSLCFSLHILPLLVFTVPNPLCFLLLHFSFYSFTFSISHSFSFHSFFCHFYYFLKIYLILIYTPHSPSLHTSILIPLHSSSHSTSSSHSLILSPFHHPSFYPPLRSFDTILQRLRTQFALERLQRRRVVTRGLFQSGRRHLVGQDARRRCGGLRGR